MTTNEHIYIAIRLAVRTLRAANCTPTITNVQRALSESFTCSELRALVHKIPDMAVWHVGAKINDDLDIIVEI